MHRHDVDQLVANPTWQEIVKTLEETRIGIVEDLCTFDPVSEGGKIARQQGRLKMLDFVLALPDSFIEELKEIEAEAEAKLNQKEEREDGN